MELRDLRIIFVIKGFLLGGTERQVLFLARHLHQEEGAHVQLVSFSGGAGPVADECAACGIPTAVIPMRLHKSHAKLLPALFKVALRFRRLRPQVLMPFLNTPNITCGLLWRLVGARSCIWNQRDQGRSATGRAIERRAIVATPRFVANSKAGAAFLVGEGAPGERVRVIPNMVDLSPPREVATSWREALGLTENSVVVAMVAHFSPRKDHESLLKGWASVAPELASKGLTPVLVLAGLPGATYRPAVELARELGIDHSVRFLGEVEDVSGLLSVTDLGVLSSRHEGSPNAVLEYMCAGLPAVATDLSGIEELLPSTDHLVQPGNADELARKLLSLLLDPGRRRQVGEQNRRFVRRHFHPSTVLSKWSDLLQHSSD